MRVRSDHPPVKTFAIGTQPKVPGRSLVRFYEDPRPYEEVREDCILRGWEYEEYHLEVENRYDLDLYVRNHYQELLAEAKGGRSALSQLEDELTALTAAIEKGLNL